MVVPKEDKEFGHRPVAFVKFHGQAIDPGHLTDILKKELPRFKIPDVFYPWSQGLGQGMKVSRRDLAMSIFPKPGAARPAKVFSCRFWGVW